MEAGERLDRLLASRAPERSRATYQRWIEQGRVEVDGQTAKAKLRPRAGQRVTVRPAPPETSAAVPQAIPLDVVFEDADLIVVNKPAGMVVHPAPGHADGTLVNAVLHHFGGLPGDAPERPGIVHRLDALTSGLLVIARTERAKRELVARFSTHDIERAYLAIVTGHPPAAVTWDTLHGRHPRDRKKFSSRVAKGKRAVTHLEVLERLHQSALVRCTLTTGRTHQIRVHCADHGFPLLGDPVYGRRLKDPRLRVAADALGRQALHAAVLGFVHPVTGDRMHFEREPPADFQRAVQALREPGDAEG